jgi:hypothetical protein
MSAPVARRRYGPSIRFLGRVCDATGALG